MSDTPPRLEGLHHHPAVLAVIVVVTPAVTVLWALNPEPMTWLGAIGFVGMWVSTIGILGHFIQVYREGTAHAR